MQRESKTSVSKKFEEWASQSLQTAFAKPLHKFGEPLRHMLDHPKMHRVCQQLLSRHRDKNRAYRYPGLRRDGRRCWIGSDAQEERIVSLALFALSARHVAAQSARQRADSVATLRKDAQTLRSLADRYPLLREMLDVAAQRLELDAMGLKIVPAYARERRDPQIRAAAVLLAGEARQLFGDCLCGCVASLLEAVYGEDVCNARDVRRWVSEADGPPQDGHLTGSRRGLN